MKKNNVHFGEEQQHQRGESGATDAAAYGEHVQTNVLLDHTEDRQKRQPNDDGRVHAEADEFT